MSYYWFNRQAILQKAKERYSKEKAPEYYAQNNEAIKESQESLIKTCHKKKKSRLRSTKEKNIKNWFSIKKKRRKRNNLFFFLSIKRVSEKTLKFNNIKVNKKEFHKSKQPIDLMSVKVDQIVVSDKFKHNNEGFKYFFGYQEGEIVKPLCIILPQMSGYIKYFENGGKNMSFLIKDDEVWEKYEQIWDVIKNKLGIKFHSEPIYEQKYLKAKVREFDGVIKTNFLGNDTPKENMHYTCTACITIDSIMRMDKKIIRRFIWRNANTE